MNENKPATAVPEPGSLAGGRPDAADKQQGDRKTAHTKTPAGVVDVFLLEKLYPEAHHAFHPTSALDPNSGSVVVALDTNALLLPYELGKGDLTDLSTVYSKIAESSRLFLPERVAREFIKHRDRKLADMVHALDQRISKMTGWNAQVSTLLLKGFDDSGEEFAMASESIGKATKTYLDVLRRLLDQMKAWRGNDPVTALYAGLFGSEQTIGPAKTEEQILEELEYGLRNKVPPGYKDGTKDDRGIGDVVIWLSLLNLGKTTKKDLIFVTGEEKADWFVRSNNQRLYPRPELVDAYRRASDGRSIRLSTLHELLREMSAPEQLVEDVQNAERTASIAVQAAASFSGVGAFTSTSRSTVPGRRTAFDYSTNDGTLHIGSGTQAFDVAFSKASDTSIHLLKRGSTKRIARVKDIDSGILADIDLFDTSSTHYTIQLNECFLVENEAGALLAGRIIGIQDDTRGADRDEVVFNYAVFEPGSLAVMP